jgi:hypothetical protein
MRIRTIKPDFFIDEDLQDLEMAHPGKYVMLTFAGLWGNCDKQGVFEWRPRSLKLHILPFLEYELAETLEILREEGFIIRFEAEGKVYGFVPTFGKHQRITGKEAQEPSRYPTPPKENLPGNSKGKVEEPPEKQQGNTGETPETTGREGKGREKEEEGKPANNLSQSVAAEKPPADEPSGRAGISHTEQALRECVAEKRDYLRETFPDADIDLEMEELVAKYRREDIGPDPWLLVIRWFRKLPNGRASPDAPGPGGGGVSLAEQVRESNRQACRDFVGVSDAGCG